jgi:hypothetical protein
VRLCRVICRPILRVGALDGFLYGESTKPRCLRAGALFMPRALSNARSLEVFDCQRAKLVRVAHPVLAASMIRLAMTTVIVLAFKSQRIDHARALKRVAQNSEIERFSTRR